MWYNQTQFYPQINSDKWIDQLGSGKKPFMPASARLQAPSRYQSLLISRHQRQVEAGYCGLKGSWEKTSGSLGFGFWNFWSIQLFWIHPTDKSACPWNRVSDIILHPLLLSPMWTEPLISWYWTDGSMTTITEWGIIGGYYPLNTFFTHSLRKW